MGSLLESLMGNWVIGLIAIVTGGIAWMAFKDKQGKREAVEAKAIGEVAKREVEISTNRLTEAVAELNRRKRETPDDKVAIRVAEEKAQAEADRAHDDLMRRVRGGLTSKEME